MPHVADGKSGKKHASSPSINYGFIYDIYMIGWQSGVRFLSQIAWRNNVKAKETRIAFNMLSRFAYIEVDSPTLNTYY